MFTQHLTVAQSKHLFISHDCVAYRCDDGLNPHDVERYRLRPLIVATLRVEHLALYWQHLFFADEPVPLAYFLYQAWTEFHQLGGLPERLMVEPMLFGVFPMRQALRQLDPNNVVSKLEAGKGDSFGATKRQAQILAKNCINETLEITDGDLPMDNQRAVLGRLNCHLKNYHRALQDEPKFCQSERNTALVDYPHRAVKLPHWPSEMFELTGNKWMEHQNLSCHTLEPNETLRANTSHTWCSRLTKIRTPFHTPHSEIEPEIILAEVSTTAKYQEGIWIGDLPGLKSIARALPFPAHEMFGSIIEAGELNEFLSGRKSISKQIALQLDSYFHAHDDRQGLVLFPVSAKAFEECVCLLDTGRGLRCYAELVGGKGNILYRIFALKDDCWLNILAFPWSTHAQNPHLYQPPVKCLGEIDIGSPGFSAISYWLEHLVFEHDRNHSLIFLEMAACMLATIPQWEEADQPHSKQ